MFSRFTVPLLVFALTTGRASAQSLNWHAPTAVARASAEAHPAVRRIEADARAAREKVIQAGSYPNPMLMGGVQNLPVDITGDEMTMYMVGASQSIPNRSRREALRSAAEIDVRRIEAEAASVRAEAEREALFAWYEVAAADSKLAALRRVGGALDALVGAVRARYEAGTAIQADIIRAQLQRSDVDHQILTETGRRRTVAARLLARLGLQLTEEVPSLDLAHTTEENRITAPREIPDSHPAIAALRMEVDRRGQEIRLAELFVRPDVNIEASYGFRPEHTDMVSVVARIELPFRKTTLIEPRVRQAIAERDSASQRIEELRRNLLSDLGAAYEAHQEATKQIEFHEQVLVPQSNLALESTRAAYEAGKATLDAVFALDATYLRLEIDYYDFLAQHMKALADFDAIRRGARYGAIAPAEQAAMPTIAVEMK